MHLHAIFALYQHVTFNASAWQERRICLRISADVKA